MWMAEKYDITSWDAEIRLQLAIFEHNLAVKDDRLAIWGDEVAVADVVECVGGVTFQEISEHEA